MSLGQSIGIPIRLMYRKPLRPLHTLKIHKSSERHPRSSSSETQYFCPLVARKGLKGTPPPYDIGVGARVAVIFCRGTPFVDVNVRGTGYEELQFLLV